MKEQIYVIKNDKGLSENIFQFLLQFVSKNKKERILKQFKRKEAENILLGDILVKYAIKKTFDIKVKDMIFSTDSNGKPYLCNFENIHFNLSHSGDYVVCVVSDKPVGIDIQKIVNVEDLLIRRVCSEEEYKTIIESKDINNEFTKLWTQKEAVLKKTGQGINHNLKNCLKNQKVKSFKLDDYWLSIFI